jgi:predicted RNA-binding protein with PIN domain
MKSLLIVDGHSIIFAWEDLRMLQARRSASAREELVKRLTRFQDITGTRVAVIFDGQGARITDDSAPGGIKVFYAPAGKTADDLVERLAAKYQGIWEVTVATSDHLEQQTAISFGARAIDADLLRREMADVEIEFQQDLKKRRRRNT